MRSYQEDFEVCLYMQMVENLWFFSIYSNHFTSKWWYITCFNSPEIFTSWFESILCNLGQIITSMPTYLSVIFIQHHSVFTCGILTPWTHHSDELMGIFKISLKLTICINHSVPIKLTICIHSWYSDKMAEDIGSDIRLSVPFPWTLLDFPLSKCYLWRKWRRWKPDCDIFAVYCITLSCGTSSLFVHNTLSLTLSKGLFFGLAYLNVLYQRFLLWTVCSSILAWIKRMNLWNFQRLWSISHPGPAIKYGSHVREWWLCFLLGLHVI